MFLLQVDNPLPNLEVKDHVAMRWLLNEMPLETSVVASPALEYLGFQWRIALIKNERVQLECIAGGQEAIHCKLWYDSVN